MTEATWGDAAKTPTIDWSISASLESVEREGQDIAEVTSLEKAVRAWMALDSAHQDLAILKTEHSIQFEGTSTAHFAGKTIAALAAHLPANQ